MTNIQKNKATISLICILSIWVVCLGWFFSVKHSFHTQKQAIVSTWTFIENNLKNRHLLLPEVTGLSQKYLKESKQISTQLTAYQSKFNRAEEFSQKAKYFNKIEGVLRQFFKLAEKNPKLTTDPQFKTLKSNLFQTEEQLNIDRRQYNEHVRYYNRFTRKFPNRYVADITNFKRYSYLNLFSVTSKNTKQN